MKANKLLSLSEEKIVSRIHMIRGKKVILDRDLAEMYGVETKNLNKAVKRNLRRFPDDFMFRLSPAEFSALRFQSGTSNSGSSSRGGLRYMPYVFTEQGVAMLSGVLNSRTAIDVNIRIIRAFTRMRELFLSQKELLLKIEKLERKLMEQGSAVRKQERDILLVFETLKRLISPPGPAPRKRIGYRRKSEND
ncbi:MAG TPA: ORF6N domain-containing protein [Bacteroidia bacterium]|nr:ORF6N domain-containing protein [Bacteroidia bacterium]